jgi:putative toxin-antitoxin system antitoxin component (TIGR02293 family)
MSALAERLERAASNVDLDGSDLARVLETNPRTVSRWLNDEASPRHDARERLLEVIAVLERLSATLTAEAGHDWLFTPNPAFEYHKPVDLIREGEFRRVLGAIDAMAEGVFV